MLEIRNCRKSYGKREVLRGVDLHFEAGSVTALLGPNGSGKTTLIKSVLGLVRPDAGEILVGGESVKGAWDYRRQLGYMAQIARFPEHLRLNELVSLLRELRPGTPDRADELIEHFELSQYRDRALGQLSGGTRQKVSAVAALMFEAPILILDEPGTGLDPLNSRRLKDIIHRERAAGRTILLTSHIMSEVEELADRIVFLLEGRIVFQGTPEKLAAMTGQVGVERAISRLLEHEGGDIHDRAAR